MIDEIEDLLGDTDIPEENQAELEVPDWDEDEEKSELHKMLVLCCPPFGRKKEVSIGILAKHLGVTSQAIYAIIRKERIRYPMVKTFLALSQEMAPRYGIEPFTLEDFDPYIV